MYFWLQGHKDIPKHISLPEAQITQTNKEIKQKPTYINNKSNLLILSLPICRAPFLSVGYKRQEVLYNTSFLGGRNRPADGKKEK